METKQETKSLPRNRKCGNCRYFEPAPLWRKGWCRNPRLYDRRANHLVDASTIDCEQVFRARIYWEPVPVPEMEEQNLVNLAGGAADGGPMPSRLPLETHPKVSNRPVINRKESGEREKTDALPGVVKKPSPLRIWLLENIPYYDKVDGPISRQNWLIIIPAVVIGLALLIIFLNIVGGKKTDNVAPVTPNATTSASGAGVLVTSSSGAANNSVAIPTPTLSNALPTATAEPVKTTAAATEKRAKVSDTGTAKSVNMRKDPVTKDDKNIVARIPEGEIVTIVGGPKLSESKEWWQISYKGQVGWAAKDYLKEIP